MICGCFSRLYITRVLNTNLRIIRRRIGRQNSHQCIRIDYLFRKITNNTQTFRGFQTLGTHLCPPLNRESAQKARKSNYKIHIVPTMKLINYCRIFSTRRIFCVNRNFEAHIISENKDYHSLEKYQNDL